MEIVSQFFCVVIVTVIIDGTGLTRRVPWDCTPGISVSALVAWFSEEM